MPIVRDSANFRIVDRGNFDRLGGNGAAFGWLWFTFSSHLRSGVLRAWSNRSESSQTTHMFVMTKPRSTFRAVLVGLMVAQLATPCQAGLFDWLFGKKQPVTQVVCCQPAACNTCCVNRTVVNYAPQTVYTTSWVRVPVTTYRPVATTDPTTCCRVNYMQPATSYVWQARRQPHVIYKPFLSRVANACATCNAGAAVPTYMPPGVGATGVVAQPGQIGGMVAAPGAAPGGYGGATYPPSPYESGVAAPSPGGVPADQRPSLDPNLQVTPQSTMRPSTDGYYYNYDGAYPAPTAPTYSDPSTDPPIGTGVPVEPPRASTAPVDSSVITKRPTPAAPPLMTPPKNESGQSESSGNGKSVPNPVLDPEASNRSAAPVPAYSAPPVPRLLNPSDRTASLRPRVAAPVSWSRARTAVFSPSAHRQAPQDDVQQPASTPDDWPTEAKTGRKSARPMVPVRLPRRPVHPPTRTITPEMTPVQLP